MSKGRPIFVPDRHICTVGEIIDTKYKVVSVIGEGSFGQVFKVTDMSGVPYALKLLHLWDVPSDIRKPLIERFEMEFQTGRIQSENLVHSLDIGYLCGNPYIVMEYCDGGDLTKKLGNDGAQTAKYAKDILSGLDALHRNGKVHRDLKPENVLIKPNGVAALTDFGISGDRNKRMTERNFFGRPYQMFGTYAYMPPEQVNRARGSSTVLPTTDIFSFGVLLYYLVTAKLPFGTLENQNDLVLYQKRGKAGEWDRTTLLQKGNGRLWEPVIEGCLKPDYKVRLQGVAEVMKLMPDFGSHIYAVSSSAQKPAPAHIAGFQLRIMQGLEYGRCYDITSLINQLGKMVLTGGRSDDNSIPLVDYQTYYTSRHHFTLEYDRESSSFLIKDGQWNPIDMNWVPSSNGTYVNSTRIGQGGWYLTPGDVITVGEITLRYESY